jgi:hypothetical protein
MITDCERDAVAVWSLTDNIFHRIHRRIRALGTTLSVRILRQLLTPLARAAWLALRISVPALFDDAVAEREFHPVPVVVTNARWRVGTADFVFDEHRRRCKTRSRQIVRVVLHTQRSISYDGKQRMITHSNLVGCYVTIPTTATTKVRFIQLWRLCAA